MTAIQKIAGEMLHFSGPDVAGKDVYNPTAPFHDRGKTYIAARVESRNSETDTRSMFFTQQQNAWRRDNGTPVFELQDPFVTRINNHLIFGGVRFPTETGSWVTEFYQGKDLLHLEMFARGPEGMKDIRLAGLYDGKIGVFTRPQGEVGGRGKIGFTIIDNLTDFERSDLYRVPLIEGHFSDEDWGGVNEVHLIRPGFLGVLGHRAFFSTTETGEQVKHYQSMVFIYDYIARESTPPVIIALRNDFPPGPAKRSPELDDILYSGGLRIINEKQAELYAGLSDARCAKLLIDNPFQSYLDAV